ncbi:MAG TPA: hypothetical protein VMI31_01810 [Fimbriimonadaceae bacterium]|nr:hypothetical protein [Fimbriimonadaceae bacterium]
MSRPQRFSRQTVVADLVRSESTPRREFGVPSEASEGGVMTADEDLRPFLAREDRELRMKRTGVSNGHQRVRDTSQSRSQFLVGKGFRATDRVHHEHVTLAPRGNQSAEHNGFVEVEVDGVGCSD